MWIGSGNAANTGILNISGEGSSLSLINKKIEESSYYDDSMVNGDAYLGYLGHAVVNVTNGGTSPRAELLRLSYGKRHCR